MEIAVLLKGQDTAGFNYIGPFESYKECKKWCDERNKELKDGSRYLPQLLSKVD